MTMSPDFKFISSAAAYESFPQDECIPIEFIALLTSISFRDSHFLFELQNFTNGEPDLYPYVVRMRCTNNESKKLAKMTISLLFQLLDIDLPEKILDDSFQPDNLHWQSLTFVECKCLYISRERKYSVLLDDIKPLQTSYVVNMALNQRESERGKVIFDIFQNLITMDRKSSDQFRFARLNNYNSDFIKSVEKLRSVGKGPVTAQTLNNPLYTANQSGAPPESQNEFDSQCIGDAGSFDTLGLDRIEESQSSVESHPSIHPNKRVKLCSPALQPTMSGTAALGTVLNLVGRMVGMFPFESDIKSALQIYFVPHDWPSLEDTDLVPDVNCLELVVPPGTKLYELFTEVHGHTSYFEDILKQDNLQVEIIRTRWKLRDELYSSHWVLQHVGQESELLSRIQRPTTAISASSRISKDQFVLFEDLTLGAPRRPRYVRMICLLVSCTFEHSQYVGMIFTDFTSNANMNQKSLLDPYLLDYQTRLHDQEGFRAFYYRNNFSAFDKRLQEVYGYSLNNMFLTSAGPLEGNVTHKGILCKLTLKVQKFDDKLNAIIRECEPITRDYTLQFGDEQEFLKRMYRVTLERMNWDSIERYKASFYKCFPPLPSGSGRLGRSEPLPNMLQIDNIADYEVKTASDIALLNQVRDQTHTLYCVEGQVLALHHTGSECHFEILITNDLISADYVDPARIVRVAIPSGASLRFFFSGGTAEPHQQDIQELRDLIVGEELRFRILRRAMRITAFQDKIAMAMIWCPIECTLEELRSQALHTSQAKPEEQDLVQLCDVKQEV